MNREQLRRLVWFFSLWTDFSDPRKSWWRFFVENVYLVATHSFLGNNYLFTSIDNEVAALVVPTVFSVFHSLVLIEILELTEVWSKHNRNFAKINAFLILFKNDLLNFAFALAGLGAVVEIVFQLLFAKLDICVDLSTVSQVSHSRFMRKDGHHSVVCFHYPWRGVDVNLSELNFVNHTLGSVLLLFTGSVLRYFLDLDFSVFWDDVLDIKLKEAIEALNLLGNETVLLKVGFYNDPSVVCVDGS